MTDAINARTPFLAVWAYIYGKRTAGISDPSPVVAAKMDLAPQVEAPPPEAA